MTQSASFSHCMLLFLLVCTNFIHTEAQNSSLICISPLSDNSCDEDQCLTLTQFATSSSNYHGDKVNLSVHLLPGNHSLNLDLSVADVGSLLMTTDSQDNETVFVECSAQSLKLAIDNVTSVTIKGLHFIGCSFNTLSQVDELIVKDTVFQGGDSRVLVLDSVSSGNLVNCAFLFNRNSRLEVSSESNSTVTMSGAVYAANSDLRIESTQFNGNVAPFGAAVSALNSNISIVGSMFMNNDAKICGGAIMLNESRMFIDSSVFAFNRGETGGALCSTNSILEVVNSTYSHNRANHAGVLVSDNSSITITNSTIRNNAAKGNGGVTCSLNDVVVIDSTIFAENFAAFGGAINASESSFTITQSNFNNNSANFEIVKELFKFEFEMDASVLSGQVPFGGTIHISRSTFTIADSAFTVSSAFSGGVIHMNESSMSIKNSILANNSAAVGGILYSFDQSILDIANCIFSNNTVKFGGVMIVIASTAQLSDSVFSHNTGSLYSFSSNITMEGNMQFENGMEAPNITEDIITRQEGGAMTSYQSNIYFMGISTFFNNKAGQGGAILGIESVLMVYNETTIANNTVTNGEGGGIHLFQTSLEVKGECIVFNNHAMDGGGIYSSSSAITVHQQGMLQILQNTARNGGGMYLEVNPRLIIVKSVASFSKEIENLVNFEGNTAQYGGAIYVADDTNSAACVSGVIDCFIQTLEVHRIVSPALNVVNMFFSKNSGTKSGSNIFGGLLDRCLPSTFAEIHLRERIEYSGLTYLANTTNVTQESIASLPVQVCFCKSNGEPDCSYQPPPVKIEKGRTFTVSLAAVDQVNHIVSGNIVSLVDSTAGDLGAGQQTQKVNTSCTDLTFNVFSPENSETITLYAEGPCGNSVSSVKQTIIEFLNCTCPIGFEPSNSEISCECECHSALSPHIANCDFATSSFLRVNTNSWVTYVNGTDPPGYIVHPNCPHDYCHPSIENVSVNLNVADGADRQCDNNRRGLLCGACQQNFSLSLGSSRCLPCHSYWPAVFVVIFLASIMAGLLLVAMLLILNLTVTMGFINGFIFYANIVAASSSVLFPSSEPTFPTVIVAWLNLDIGIDVCFIDGLDAYGKTWLQLLFPVYIISLVVVVIITSEYSPKFANFIGKRDPVATLATLILLSYAKLLSITISVLSFTVLHYPDGSQETVWLIDGNVKYFQGKHIALAVVALLIITVGIPFTILLFIWQWLVQVSSWKTFEWTTNTKLNVFISIYQIPYNSDYRYWTGLLLLIRVAMYVTVAVTLSVNTQIQLLMIINLVGGLFFLEGSFGMRVYRQPSVDIVNKVVYLNLLVFATFTMFNYNNDLVQQTVYAYISTGSTLLLLVSVIIYQVVTLCGKRLCDKNQTEHPTDVIHQVNPQVTHTEVSRTELQIPTPTDRETSV